MSTSRNGLQGLAALAGLMRDRSLEELRQAEARCAQTRALIDGLEVPPGSGLPIVAQARAEAAYQIWADGRRRELNALLARQMVEKERSLGAARKAYGRTEALNGLIDRQNNEAQLRLRRGL